LKNLKRFKYAIVLTFILIALFTYNSTIGLKAVNISIKNMKEMLSILPAIFIIIGLLDVWVPKEVMVKYMGEKSGVKGILIALSLGTAAAGPLYAAFPIAAMLLKKGAKLSYVIFFLGVWSSAKLPLLLFEATSLGVKFTLLHVALSLPLFLITSFEIYYVPFSTCPVYLSNLFYPLLL